MIESNYTRYFTRNLRGRDYVTGDIHGFFSRLRLQLDLLGFDPDTDRLFCVGDLVDRGPESAQVIEWLKEPWFHSVRGNHEQLAIDHVGEPQSRNAADYLRNGGGWFVDMARAEQQIFSNAFRALPIAITLETEAGLVGIVHAECPVQSWQLMLEGLEGPARDQVAQLCMCSRSRFKTDASDEVDGILAVIVGHTSMPNWVQLGNTIYIDTSPTSYAGDATILDAATLRPVEFYLR